MEKIKVYTKSNCKNCLGAGIAALLNGGQSICSCVTEQLEIHAVEKDYAIRGAERYTPGQPSFVKEDLLQRLTEARKGV